MSKKITNITLIVILIVLMLVYLAVKQFSGADRTFREKIADFNAAKVTELRIVDPVGKTEVSLYRNKSVWEVELDGKRHMADSAVVGNILKQLNNLKTKQLAGSGKEAWIKYQVTDTSAIMVTASAGRKELARVYVGKISYSPGKGTTPQQQQQQADMATYVRLEGDKNVYTVEGMVRMNFNRKASEYRNKKMVSVSKDDMTRITFEYPEYKMLLEKQGRHWFLDGQPTDSFKVAKYTAILSRLSNPNFVDPVAPGIQPSHVLTLEGTNFGPIRIEAYPAADPDIQYIMHSSLNPDAYFNGGKNGLFIKVMVKQPELLPVK